MPKQPFKNGLRPPSPSLWGLQRQEKHPSKIPISAWCSFPYGYQEKNTVISTPSYQQAQNIPPTLEC